MNRSRRHRGNLMMNLFRRLGYPRRYSANGNPKGTTMTKPLIAWLILVCTCPCFSQEMSSEETDFVNKVNGRLRAMYLALGELQNADSELELVDDQRIALANLAEDYRELERSAGKLPKTGDIKERFVKVLDRLDMFERRLTSDILLPHQSAVLDTMVFNRMVTHEGGNLIAAISTHYGDDFKFSKNQTKRIGELRTSVDTKIAKARKEFQEKLKKISAEAKTEFRTILTPKQSKVLSELLEDRTSNSRNNK